MKHFTPILILLGILLIPSFASADEAKVIKVSGFEYAYDEVVARDTDGNDIKDRNSYYKAGKLVLTAYDENEDGKDDLWFAWENDAVTLEMRATGGGAGPDEFTVIDNSEKALAIDTPNGSASGGTSWLVILAVIGGLLWWYSKKRGNKSPVVSGVQ